MVDYYVVLGARGFLTYDDEHGRPSYCTSANDAATFSTAREALRVASAFGAGVCACVDGVEVQATLLTLSEVKSHILDESVTERM